MDITRRSTMFVGLAAGAASVLGHSNPATAQERENTNLPPDPIAYWSDVSLDLVALDHTVDGPDARAPGPCATARALGLVHAAMADAVTYVYEDANYNPRFVTSFSNVPADRENGNREAFIGGVAAALLGFIYDTPAHAHLLGTARRQFTEAYSSTFDAWQAGAEFGLAEDLRLHWNADDILTRLLDDQDYRPIQHQHQPDPLNPGQRYYGVNWGEIAPLVIRTNQTAPDGALGPGNPPGWTGGPILTISQEDIDMVRQVGTLQGDGANEEQQTGLFWAYDGARLLGTPPRLYNQIVRDAIRTWNLSTPELARLLALCNIAMADAGVVAWKAKYYYKIPRPIKTIHDNNDITWRPLGAPRTNPREFEPDLASRNIIGGQTTGPESVALRATAQEFLGADLPDQALFPSRLQLSTRVEAINRLAAAVPDDRYAKGAFTPNFPAFPSGHATFGSACLGILKQFPHRRTIDGTDMEFPDGEDEVDMTFISEEVIESAIDNFVNRPRSSWSKGPYQSIQTMIDDNNRSRLLLGVHWEFDSTQGSTSGLAIANAVMAAAYGKN